MNVDLIQKEFWKDKERFADFFNTFFFNQQEVIRPEELEDLPQEISHVEVIDQKLDKQAKYRDVIKVWKGSKLVILGIENQEKIHYAMPERVFLFDALQYEGQRKEIAAYHKKAKDLKDDQYLSGFSKEDKLCPVLTVVIYYGEKPWDGPRSLGDIVNVPEEIRSIFRDYPMYLFEVVGNDGGCFHNEDIRKVMRNAEAIRNKRIKDLDKDLDAEMVKYLAAFVNSETILKISERKENGEVCTALNEMFQEKLDEGLSKGRAEGIAKGRAEGRAEGKTDALAESIFNLMESAKWDAMQAMSALRIPESERPMYLERVEAMRGK
jgi:hypothetical protein